ncbi:GIY-YIG nuclease family protein [Lutibaculum baratangense]|uniref:GIY-YIG domain-containing protein n=1 Tax=Lutibaculum baratangense AMV1 TaxID=631454 RepID=V4TJ81_9HYPH|nr:GIY-YIG nuclease family protein [Lutibaculum baratangense]ESR25983.1 hypothetical protein N177_1318 [Lutibaculum baratangense AMV1]
MEQKFWAYILTNKRNGALYVGMTSDLVRRMDQHRSGVVPGFTRRYGVKRLVHAEQFSDVYEALYRERQLKAWRRAWKMRLIEEANPQWRDLAEELFI